MIRYATFLLMLAVPGTAWSQAAGAYDPQGVHLDAEGVLRSRRVDPDPRLSDLRRKARSFRREGGTIFVSLPRLVGEARRIMTAGEPLPNEIRYVGGMTKLTHVFVFPEEKDLVISGEAEPFDATVAYRPLGRISGRPVLHLDDIVAALRAFAPGKNPDRLGCDIEITQEIQKRVADKTRAIGPAAGIVGFKKTCARIAEAGGPQPVTYYGIETGTRFAFVCVEADYRLKQLALGILPSPVKKVRSYRSLLLKPERQHRFSLESNYEALLVSPEGNAFELRGPSLRVNGGLLGDPSSTLADVTPPARKFVELCNENFEALRRTLVSWADLCNLGDVSVLAALVIKDGLADRAGWDLEWVLDPKGYAPLKINAPRSAATLCTYVASGRSAIFVSGGVWIKPADWASKRAQDGKVAGKAVRPKKGWRTGRK